MTNEQPLVVDEMSLVISKLYRQHGIWRVFKATIFGIIERWDQEWEVKNLSNSVRRDIGLPLRDDDPQDQPFNIWHIRF